jgi:DDE family transposase
VATNWRDEEKSGMEVLEWHNQRGQAENFNKKLKNGFGMERMPCGQTGANAVFFRIGIIAYNLFIGFKMLSCSDTWVKPTIATFRWKRIQVAGRIVRHSGSVMLRIAAGMEKVGLFLGIRRRICELSLDPDS